MVALFFVNGIIMYTLSSVSLLLFSLQKAHDRVVTATLEKESISLVIIESR